MDKKSQLATLKPQIGRLATLLGRFPRVRVLVVGDLMLDRYIWGQVQRISPEAPVPVVQVTRESLHAGGAGNVVANIRTLGGSVVACGITLRVAPSAPAYRPTSETSTSS